jgi:hypothetical protein
MIFGGGSELNAKAPKALARFFEIYLINFRRARLFGLKQLAKKD